MDYDNAFMVGARVITAGAPTYFIADIGANHDGQLHRAKELIRRAKDAGADCAKFQHFKAEKIVSAVGFDGFKTTHQRGWDRSVFEVYADASINPDWNRELYGTAQEVGIDFMTTPYDFESVDEIDPMVLAYKIGSGDITHHPLVRYIASRKKPVFLATGASTLAEVSEATDNILPFNRQLCLLQCNTNYTGDLENFRYVNLRVLQTYMDYYPGLPLGLSDHTPGCTAVLGAVALGACVIEKHFTDDSDRKGPDHKFALEPWDWEYMVKQVRRLEPAMGDGVKRVEANEMESRIVQRRALRFKKDQPAGTIISLDMLDALRPCPREALTPVDIDDVVGRTLVIEKKLGDVICLGDLE